MNTNLNKRKKLPLHEEKKQNESFNSIDAKQKELEFSEKEAVKPEEGMVERKEILQEIVSEGLEEKGISSEEIKEDFSVPPAVQIRQQAQLIKNLDKDNQVKILCDLAFEKGIDFAIKTAKNLDNPYVLDAFHDTLVDELYERLKKAGKIEEV